MNKFVYTVLKKILLFAIFSGFNISLFAQSDADSADIKEAAYWEEKSFLPMESLSQTNSIPHTFVGVQKNTIVDKNYDLSSFYSKLNMLLEHNYNGDKPVVRIVHIGDSHVRGHIVTSTLASRFEKEFGNQAQLTFIGGYNTPGIVEESGLPGVVCQCFGINGATSKNFSDNQTLRIIAKLKPDLIIISLGTNESLLRYNEDAHYDDMDILYSMIKEYCPNASILYTTPPGSFRIKYNRTRYRSRRKIISVSKNPDVVQSAATIRRFAQKHKCAYWDLFNIVGGNESACKNWENAGMLQSDKIHFSAEGYTLQGNLLYEALCEGYNNYVGN